MLKNHPSKAKQLAGSLEDLHEGVDYCQKTFALVPKGQELSDLYTDSRRNKQVIAIVAEPLDIVAIEGISAFKGTYHVLGGLLSPIDGISPQELRLDALLERIKEDEVEELILAINATVEGESTALLIQKMLEGTDVKLTRLAQGLPIGVDIEYADQITLAKAFDGRRDF